jgi:preprotein translocase subunit SecA
MLQKVLKKFMGSKSERSVKKMRPLVASINALEPRFEAMTDRELRLMTDEFRTRHENGESLDSMMQEAFAVCREAARRVLGMRPYDVQLIGAIMLDNGKVTEMRTGEGKTLTATMPVYLNGLSGRGVHVVTVNDYLARRDAEWMGRLYRFLGLTVGVIYAGMSDEDRKAAYLSDITYGQNNEFGFDYLRDNLKMRLEDYAQRELNYAIVDEVDSILIDEARTPLIISGPSAQSSKLYYKINAIIPFLKEEQDYTLDEKAMACSLTDMGVDRVEKRLGVGSLFDPSNIDYLHHVNTALRAHTLFKRDQHYLVEDSQIVIVDEFTGRKMTGRRWSDGLHQAVEAKEGLKVGEENQTLATITFQNYFRMYNKLSGMTGTADTEAGEFHKIYNLEVVVIPTNRPIDRDDEDDYIYVNEPAKYRAILDDIRDCRERGQPVLVGTTNVERNEFVGKLLEQANIPFQMLNAKAHASEADIVALAGQPGAITVATNMAGRGTDIILGGNPELLAVQACGVEEGPEYDAALEQQLKTCAADRQHVVQAGGLRVIGTERHESRRIDNQLRGRAGRQGDPGSSRFYMSLDDDLLRIFGGEKLKLWMARFKVPEDEPITHRMVTKVIESSQTKVEARNFDIRKNLLEYDDVMNEQRKHIYELRRRALEGREIHEWLSGAVNDVASGLVDQHCPEGALAEDWDLDAIINHAKNTWGLEVDWTGVDTGSFTAMEQYMMTALTDHYEARCQKIADQLYRLHEHEEDATPEYYWGRWVEYEQEQLLRTVDSSWKNHLLAMDHLREGIHLEAYAQKDPKMVYKKEAFNYFEQLLAITRVNVVETLFRVEVRSEEQIEELKREREERARQLADEQKAMHAEAQSLVGGGTNAAGVAQPQRTASGKQQPDRREAPKVGRNDPCPCGSGKKYKKCCIGSDQAAQQA